MLPFAPEPLIDIQQDVTQTSIDAVQNVWLQITVSLPSIPSQGSNPYSLRDVRLTITPGHGCILLATLGALNRDQLVFRHSWDVIVGVQANPLPGMTSPRKITYTSPPGAAVRRQRQASSFSSSSSSSSPVLGPGAVADAKVDLVTLIDDTITAYGTHTVTPPRPRRHQQPLLAVHLAARQAILPVNEPVTVAATARLDRVPSAFASAPSPVAVVNDVEAANAIYPRALDMATNAGIEAEWRGPVMHEMLAVVESLFGAQAERAPDHMRTMVQLWLQRMRAWAATARSGDAESGGFGGGTGDGAWDDGEDEDGNDDEDDDEMRGVVSGPWL